MDRCMLILCHLHRRFRHDLTAGMGLRVLDRIWNSTCHLLPFLPLLPLLPLLPILPIFPLFQAQADRGGLAGFMFLNLPNPEEDSIRNGGNSKTTGPSSSGS